MSNLWSIPSIWPIPPIPKMADTDTLLNFRKRFDELQLILNILLNKVGICILFFQFTVKLMKLK
jgi:hypothetical protein